MVLLTTSGIVGQDIQRFMTNNPRPTWGDLKVSLGVYVMNFILYYKYSGVVPNPNTGLVELAKEEQGEYMQRVVRLVEGTYIGVDWRNEVVSKQVLGFFIEGLREKEIKMAVMKEPQTLEAAYQTRGLRG